MIQPNCTELLKRSQGEPLDRELRARLERLFHTELARVRVHTGEPAAHLTRSIGASAFAHGENVFFKPGQYAPNTNDGMWLLAHELAHVIQQRGGMRPIGSPGRPHGASHLEAEASLAASRVVAGMPASVAPSADCPPILPAIPLAIWGLMAAAAAVGLWSATRKEDIEADLKDTHEHTYETGWGFIPFVGSVDQVMNGRSVAQRLIGTVFLVMDVSLAGGVVKGVALALRGAGRLAFSKLAQGAGTAAAREGYETLVRQGARFGTKEQVAKEIMELSRQGPIAVAGAEEWLNHSVTYLINNGRVWKMQGGPLIFMMRPKLKQIAAEAGVEGIGTRLLTPEQVARVVKRLNSVSLYRVEAAAAKQTVRFWEQEISRTNLGLFLKAEGCAGTQALLLQQLGHGVPWSSGFRRYAPLFPIFMEGGRMGGPGVHRILRPGWSLLGTTAQFGLGWLLPREIAWTPNWVQSQLGPVEARAKALELALKASEENTTLGMHLERVPEGTFSSELWSEAPAPPLTGPLQLELPQDYLEQAARAASEAATRNGSGGGTHRLPVVRNGQTVLPPLDAGEQRVHQVLTSLPKTSDQIMRQTGMTPRQVAQALEGLVQKGLARWVQVNSDLFGYAKAR
jgi:hypothetical protein